jgi:hypothetical protein
VGGVSYRLGSDVGGVSYRLGSDVGELSYRLSSDVGGVSYRLSSNVGGVSYCLGNDVGRVSYCLGNDVGEVSYCLGNDVHFAYFLLPNASFRSLFFVLVYRNAVQCLTELLSSLRCLVIQDFIDFYRQVRYRKNPYIRRLRIYIHEKPSFVIYLDI